MRKGDFLGKIIDGTRIEELGFAEWGEDLEGNPVIEILLFESEEGFFKKGGYTEFSLQIELTENRISKIYRIGHCHMSGGQGSDDELLRFPYRSLENEAQGRLETLVSRLSLDAS